MPRYKIIIDAPDHIYSIPDLDRLADRVYDLVVGDVHPGTDNVTVEAKYD